MPLVYAPLSWASFKSVKITLGLTIYTRTNPSTTQGPKYTSWLISSLAAYTCYITTSSDITDYETNFAGSSVTVASQEEAVAKRDSSVRPTSMAHSGTGAYWGLTRSLDVTCRTLPTVNGKYNAGSADGAQASWYYAEITTTSASEAVVLDLSSKITNQNATFWIMAWGLNRLTSGSTVGGTKKLRTNPSSGVTVHVQSAVNAVAGTDAWHIELPYAICMNQNWVKGLIAQTASPQLTITPSATTSTLWGGYIIGYFDPNVTRSADHTALGSTQVTIDSESSVRPNYRHTDNVKLSWTAFKGVKTASGFSVYVMSLGANDSAIKYILWMVTPSGIYQCYLPYSGSADISDYETNYAPTAISAAGVGDAIEKRDKLVAPTSALYSGSGSLYGNVRSLDITQRTLPAIQKNYPAWHWAGDDGGFTEFYGNEEGNAGVSWTSTNVITTTSTSVATVGLAPLQSRISVYDDGFTTVQSLEYIDFWLLGWVIERATVGSTVGAIKTIEFSKINSITLAHTRIPVAKSVTNAAVGADQWSVWLKYPILISAAFASIVSGDTVTIDATITPLAATSTAWSIIAFGVMHPTGRVTP